MKYKWKTADRRNNKCHLMWTDGATAADHHTIVNDHELKRRAPMMPVFIPSSDNPSQRPESVRSRKKFESTMQSSLLRINHFPGMSEFVNKAYLARKLNFFRELFPDEYDFFPRSWDLRNGLGQFEEDFEEGKTYLMKPSHGLQGAGIILFQELQDAREYMERFKIDGVMVQEYLDRPLCLDGYKWDLRVYVLLESLNPLKVHVMRDGLARLATQKYVRPDKSNLKDIYVHLTNYSLNKNNEDFKAAGEAETDDGEQKRPASAGQTDGGDSKLHAPSAADVTMSRSVGSSPRPADSTTTSLHEQQSAAAAAAAAAAMAQAPKPGTSPMSQAEAAAAAMGTGTVVINESDTSKRRIVTAFKQLHEQGVDMDVDKVWADIDDLVVKTLTALWGSLHGAYVSALPAFRENVNESACFHLLGFDVLLDEDLKPWLLEVNSTPSFATGSILDLRIKQGVMERALELMGYIHRESFEQQQIKAAEEAARLQQQRDEEAASAVAADLNGDGANGDGAAASLASSSAAAARHRKAATLDSSFSLDKARDVARRLTEADEEDESEQAHEAELGSYEMFMRRRKKERKRGKASKLRSSRSAKSIRRSNLSALWRKEVDPNDPEAIKEAAIREKVTELALDTTGKWDITTYNSSICLHCPDSSILDSDDYYGRLFLFGAEVLTQAYLKYAPAKTAHKGLTSTKFLSLLRHYDVIGDSVTRAEVDLIYVKAVKNTFENRDCASTKTMGYNLFVETMFLLALKRYPQLSALDAFRSLVAHMELSESF
eukprot:TRINITY_DN66324_c2_g1_i3.p1 TRINITY_DN66324_c2_g1~~TRINITY_DN66324_c2_g1_i3.p1  ORF type:complete len:774 (+),score=401.85 TRINITY_DN66324_c2_g1_i3:653-2974(+)